MEHHPLPDRYDSYSLKEFNAVGVAIAVVVVPQSQCLPNPNLNLFCNPGRLRPTSDATKSAPMAVFGGTVFELVELLL
ncbi:hypothetical protein BJP36_09730 [Moorena producens JHB]|uniref:Uncharacterized protein n=1 Tax=Moorena producens (strain JHB) TaxID=1454205 RepID=A0A1D9FXS0_MOOP1|nr:hypothetical protein [Moorena producens]AOY80168.1 hypothetical protein BJP36_09730 [Moorena producens JHB]